MVPLKYPNLHFSEFHFFILVSKDSYLDDSAKGQISFTKPIPTYDFDSSSTAMQLTRTKSHSQKGEVVFKFYRSDRNLELNNIAAKTDANLSSLAVT